MAVRRRSRLGTAATAPAVEIAARRSSGALAGRLKKIIISTVQKFPFILDEIGSEHRGRRFAFIATPKNKTLELFGEAYGQGDQRKHRPFHSYTMKQAIDERFVLDVLAHYTPVESYYKLVKTVEGDPEFDTKRAKKKLRRYVESHDHAIRIKAEIMVDHFLEQVLALQKIGGQARAMVVTSGIERAIQYYHPICEHLQERKSPHWLPVLHPAVHERRVGQADRQNARIEHDEALVRVMTAVLKDDTQLFKEFSDNESFRRWLTDTVFGLTYSAEAT